MESECRIAISGFSSVLTGQFGEKLTVSVDDPPWLVSLLKNAAPMTSVGPGAALTGAFLASLGFACAVESGAADDAAGRSLRAALENAPPNLLLMDRECPEGHTWEMLACREADGEPVPRPGFLQHRPRLMDLPILNEVSKTIGIWCDPPALMWACEEMETGFLRMMERHAEAGLTQVMRIGRPIARRHNGNPWQEWLCSVLPFTNVLCAQADHLVEMLDPDSAGNLASRGTLRVLPEWLTGRILHDLSGYLLSHGLGVVVIGLRENGIYLRSNENSSHVSFVRKFAPDDRTAAHLAAWTERDMLIPLFETDNHNLHGITDALTAGMTAALLAGNGPEEAVRTAAAVVSFAIEGKEPMAAIPPLEVVEARINGGWAQAHCKLDLSGWSDDS